MQGDGSSAPSSLKTDRSQVGAPDNELICPVPSFTAIGNYHIVRNWATVLDGVSWRRRDVRLLRRAYRLHVMAALLGMVNNSNILRAASGLKTRASTGFRQQYRYRNLKLKNLKAKRGRARSWLPGHHS